MRVGIDPGIHGAIALVWDKKILLFDMPNMTIPWVITSKYKTMVDVNALYNILEPYMDEIESVTIEIVGIRPAQGAASQAVLVGALHAAISTVKLMGFEPNMIQPGKWKRKWGLINMPKDMSRLVAIKMYPHLLPELKRKKDVDRAEALLIAVS